MSSNPYEPPASPKSEAVVRISNLNHAGGPIAFALLATVLAIVMIWLNLHQEGPLSGREYIYAALNAAVAIAAIGYACKVPVIWIELGSAIRFRKLLSTRTIDWQQIQSVRFTDKSTLLIVIDDYHDAEVYVPDCLRERVQAVLAAAGKLGYIRTSESQER